jgi:allantoin racemase
MAFIQHILLHIFSSKDRSMTYRIGVIGTGAGYTGNSIPPAAIAELASAGFKPELIETRLRTFPLTPFDRGLTALAYVDCAIEAERAGFDAVLINTFGDYGIDEMKSATDMVIVGAGEATMAMCCNIGHKFSIVTVWPPRMNFVYHERLRNCAMEQRCVSIRNILGNQDVTGIEGAGQAISKLQARDDSIQDRILAAIDVAVNQDGADTIILGCTCMAAVGPEIARRAQVPVLESMRTGYKTAETMLSLGIRHSHQAWPKANPANLDAVGALISAQGNVELGGDCEVCVT